MSIEKCSVPIIAAIHGYWLGAGMEVVTAWDIRYASIDSTFSIREMDIGAVADFGTLQRFGRKTGNGSWFRDIAYTAKMFDAKEAKTHGFVTRVFEDQKSQYIILL